MIERLADFRRDGFLVLEAFNTHEECDALMQRAEELAAKFDYDGHASIFQTNEQTRTSDDYFLDSGDKISFFFEKDAFDDAGQLKTDIFHALNKIGHAMHDLDAVFDQFSRSPQMRQLATDLGLAGHVLIQSMYIFKHARVGGVVDAHQDSTFLYTEPASCVGFWFALEDATTENGCLWAKPGGHNTTLRSWFRRKDAGGTESRTFDDSPYDLDGAMPLEVKKGTCIVLDGMLPHYSLLNTSDKSRHAYTLHAISPRSRYPIENWLRRDLSQLRPI